MSLADALVELQELTERLRRECPWDREQTARTIVPHTVEEAYEVADAALAGDDAKLLDEIGDLLFQCVLPLAAARGARRAATSSRRARGVHAKLVSRHPHVFGDVEAEHGRARARALGADQARGRGPRRGSSTTCPRGCPRCSTRARCSCARSPSASSTPTSPARSPTSTTSCASCATSCPPPIPEPETEPAARVAAELGDVLFAAVNVARRLNVDPELELRGRRQAVPRPRRAGRARSRRPTGRIGRSSPLDEQDAYYDQAKGDGAT